MLFDTEIEPASSAWRQPLQMRARSEVVPGLEWETSHFGIGVDCVAFHAVREEIEKRKEKDRKWKRERERER